MLACLFTYGIEFKMSIMEHHPGITTPRGVNTLLAHASVRAWGCQQLA